MKTRSNLLYSLVAAAALMPAAASAEPAVTTHGVNMRAGPDVSYPQVAFLGRGMRVNVVGCVDGWQWCEVIAGPNRGWVYAGYLSYSYYNRPTVIAYGGPALGIPLISFSIGPYWDSYYRGRPFWNQRTYWYKHRVARAPEWHAPPGWHGGGDWRGHDNRGRGRDDRRARNDGGSDPRLGSQYSSNEGPDPRPHINDQFHPNEQQ